MTHYIIGVKREGDISLAMGQNGLALNYNEHYHVRADTKDVQMWEVMRDAIPFDASIQELLPVNGLPLPGVTVGLEGICVCQSLNGTRNAENPLLWDFTAAFSSDVNSGGLSNGYPNGPGINPVTDVTILRETLSDPITRHRSFDYSGRAYVNGAGTLFSPPLEVEEESPRWDFTQFDYYVPPNMVVSNSPTFVGLSGGAGQFARLTALDSVGDNIKPPGIYYNSGGWILYAPTDDTIMFLNGAINQVAYKGYGAFTLLLKVRRSYVATFYGTMYRSTDFTIIYEPRNHWDKPLNAGPFFLAPELDSEGDPVGGGAMATYPYIYYTGETEHEDTDLTIDETGPLGSRNIGLTLDGNGYVTPGVSPNVSDGEPSGGYELVTTATGKKTYRAKRITNPLSSANRHYIEYANHQIVDFASVLRLV